jgi:hypothetical protein
VTLFGIVSMETFGISFEFYYRRSTSFLIWRCSQLLIIWLLTSIIMKRTSFDANIMLKDVLLLTVIFCKTQVASDVTRRCIACKRQNTSS